MDQQAAVNPTDTVPVKFHFKGKEDAAGNKTRRPTVELSMQLINLNGLVEILNGGDEKQISLVIESLREVQIGQARGYVNDDEQISNENFPHDKVTWAYIANLPPAQRRGAGITKERLEEFAVEYIKVMPGVSGKNEKQVKNAAFFFVQKLNPLKNHPEKNVHLSKLKEQLALFAETPNAADFEDVIEFLNNKADAFIQSDSISDALNNM